uniref:WAT1-related protein n=1 Tax=Oryza nivara TaxID=4536 RepID=A0A0E0IJS3_ORYNI
MAGGGGGWWVERYGPCVGMVMVQWFYAAVDMALKAAYGMGMRPIVFVAYRQGIAAATLLLASLAARGWDLRRHMAVGAPAFALLFAASLARYTKLTSWLILVRTPLDRIGRRPLISRLILVGSATGQYFYFLGLQLASPSMARATTNLAPGITFAIAAVIGLEKVDLRSSRSLAKIAGTVVCLAGAMAMAFFKGPKLLGAVLVAATTDDDWVKGGIYLIGNAFCVSIWYILQVPVCRSYLDPLSLATWMCFLATLQCAVMAFFLESNYLQIWKLASIWELPCILYGGVFASGANFFLQSWCISVKGPLYSAIFTPLSAVITTILSTIFLHEELHIGSILGAIAIIIGLYVVLWGKADDAKSEGLTILSNDSKRITEPECTGVKVECGTNLSVPLLSGNANANT